MKQFILFIVIFTLGAVSYSFLNPLLLSFLNREPEEKEIEVVTPNVEEKVEEKTVVVETPKKVEQKVTVDEDGAVHDGPFTLVDANGSAVTGTVEIIRAPEETLLQFKNVELNHSAESNIYFATDKKATKYMNLGPAKLRAGVFVYGMPLDADLSVYNYILIYNPDTNVTEFSAEI